MNHWERLQAAIRGEALDHPPISLWRHWPEIDQDPGTLAKAMIDWQRIYDFDLVKYMPTGTYSIEDWGARTIYKPTRNGTRTVTRFGVTDVEQWPRLQPLDGDSPPVRMPSADTRIWGEIVTIVSWRRNGAADGPSRPLSG